MFRFLELELHGWDLWSPLRIPLDAGVVVLSGPNGAGKTTMLDAIRQLLHANRLSQNRRITHYLRVPNQPALLRAVVSNRADQRGRRPFERQQVLTDEATLACALVPNGSSPEKRFVVLAGRVPPQELQARLLESREWLAPEQYRRVLENAGVSRSLMHILALEQGRADELSRQKPRELFRWVMEARGTQQVLERYTSARTQYEDSIREVDRQRAQVQRCQVDLAELDRKVRRLDEYRQRKERVETAEKIKAAAPLQSHLSELRDIEKKLPELRTKSTNLAITSERLKRELDAQQARIKQLEANLQAQNEAARSATEDCDKAIAFHAELAAEAKRLMQAAEELASIPCEDLAILEKELLEARGNQFRLEQLGTERTSQRDEISKVISSLEQGVRRYPVEVTNTLEALREAGVKAFLTAERVEIADETFSAAVESALGNLRYAICVEAAAEKHATTIARSHGFPGPIVSSTALTKKAVENRTVQFVGAVPHWLTEWAERTHLMTKPDTLLTGALGVSQDGTRRDAYGVWVSLAPNRVLGGSAVRHQLDQARREKERLDLEITAVEKNLTLATSRLSELNQRMIKQNRRTELVQLLNVRPEVEQRLYEAEALSKQSKEERNRLNQAATAAEKDVLVARTTLQQKEQELTERNNELHGTRDTVRDMEHNSSLMQSEIESLKATLDPDAVVQAEKGELPTLALAEKDVERTRKALKELDEEGEIPPETVRQERLVLQRNLDTLVRHVQDRQQEADAARTELDQCRGEYLNVIRSTLHDYSKRARALAEMASAKLEVELPDLRNDDKSLDNAGIVVRIGFDGKSPTELADAAHSGGQQVIAGLILLMAMAETEGESFFIVDEPFAHLSLDRVDDVGKFLRKCGAQFLITVPTTLDRGQLDPASLLIVLRKKAPSSVYAPSPIVARA